MAMYRFFPINAEGRIVGPGTDLDYVSDAAAMEALPALLDDRDGLEVWIGTRRLVTVRNPRLAPADA